MLAPFHGRHALLYPDRGPHDSVGHHHVNPSTYSWALKATHLQELSDLHLDYQPLLDLLLLLQLVLKCAGQHVGEQLQQQRQRQLHEGDHL